MDSDAENDLDLIHEVEVENETQAGGEEPNNDDDEAVEDNGGEERAEAKVIKPKRVVKNPQYKLNAETLRGKRGLSCMPELFRKQKYMGKGHEEQDLRVLLKTYEYWCHRLFPRYTFEQCVSSLERLGNKRPVITYVKKIRMGLMEEEPEDKPIQNDEDDEMPTSEVPTTTATSQAPSAEQRFDLVFGSNAGEQLLTEEQLKRIRMNKERALKIRQERLKRIQQQAESKLTSSNQLPAIATSEESSEQMMETDVMSMSINEEASSQHDPVLTSDGLMKNNDENNTMSTSVNEEASSSQQNSLVASDALMIDNDVISKEAPSSQCDSMVASDGLMIENDENNVMSPSVNEEASSSQQKSIVGSDGMCTSLNEQAASSQENSIVTSNGLMVENENNMIPASGHKQTTSSQCESTVALDGLNNVDSTQTAVEVETQSSSMNKDILETKNGDTLQVQ